MCVPIAWRPFFAARRYERRPQHPFWSLMVFSLSIPHPGHRHPAAEQQSPLRRDPSRFPQVPFCTHDHGWLTLVRAGRTIYLALRKPDCTLSRLFALVAEEYNRPVTQSIATPEQSCPDPHHRSSRSLLKPWVSPHSGGDGLVQGELPPSTWILTVFTSLACYPGAPLTAETRLAWAGIGEDCRPPYHVAATYPFWEARLFLCCD